MESAYITGIAGFLGSHIAKKLQKQNIQVLGCDNLLTGSVANIPDGIPWTKSDIRSDLDIPNVDVIFHTAAIARSAWPDDAEVIDVNVQGTRRVIDWALKHDARLVYSSSSMADLPGANTYAFSKHLSEREVIESGGIALRYSNIYGPGQSTKGSEPNVLAAWKKQLKENGCLRVDGLGDQVRDFIHVDDVVRANILAWKMDSDWYGEWYDICTGTEISILELAILFDAPIRFAPRRLGDPMRIKQDYRDAFDMLSFKAEHIGIDHIKEVM